MTHLEADWYSRLLDAITSAQEQLLGIARHENLFEGLLNALLELSDSEYGFIGEVRHKSDGTPYLKTHAITNIAWDEATRNFYDENISDGLEFHNLQTLFGAVLVGHQPVIANAPARDPRRGGLPEGHPPLNAFLGIPLHSGGRMIGMAGIANRPGGYDQQLLSALRPFVQTCANAIFALRADTERNQALTELDEERQRLGAILDSAYEAIITIDERGIIDSCNGRAEEMFGHRRDSLLGQSVEVLMPVQMRSEHKQYLKNYRETGEAKIIGSSRDVIGVRRDGSEFPIQLTINEVHAGRRRLFTGMVRDLSEVAESGRRLEQLQHELERSQFGQLIGSSPPMRRLYKVIADVAPSDWTVLIEGETGTGKELIARAIHAASSRREGPFIAVNCAALSDGLLASQLFGHRRGSFTGAVADQAGYFQAARGGTLFLDEVGDMSEEVQTTLLRALDSHEVLAIGDTQAKKVNVRVIAATNRNLNAMVKTGTFREDLHYRLRVGRIEAPPLRDRGSDISILAESFLAEARVATGKAIAAFSPRAITAINTHNWPGNVRELRSAIQYAAIHCHTEFIELADLPPEVAQAGPSLKSAPAETSLSIAEALEIAGGNRSKAAEILGISRATFYRKLKSSSNTE